MNFFVVRLDNFIMGPEHFVLSDEPEFGMRLINVHSKIMIGENDARPLVFSPLLRDSIGSIRFETLKQHPFLLFVIPSDEWDLDPHSKEEYDKKYHASAFACQRMSLCLSLAAWLVKNSCISVQQGYWINLFSQYASINNTSYQPTNSSGLLQAERFSKREIKLISEYFYQLSPYLINIERGIILPETSHGGTTYFSQEKAAGLVGLQGKSFVRALLKLQEARRAGNITSKIEYGCSALEALFAISSKHRYNLKTITAGYVGESEKEKEQIKSLLDAAYGIRSDHSHGDYLQFLRTNQLDSLGQVSVELDNVLRKVFRKILKQPELNYSSEPADIDRVRQYWDSIRAE